MMKHLFEYLCSFLVLRHVDLLIENRKAFPSLSFYISVLTLKRCCYVSGNTPESTETNANSHLQDKQIHTASVDRNTHLKEGECEKKSLWLCNFISCEYAVRTSESGLFSSLAVPLAERALQEICQGLAENLLVPLQYFPY